MCEIQKRDKLGAAGWFNLKTLLAVKTQHVAANGSLFELSIYSMGCLTERMRLLRQRKNLRGRLIRFCRYLQWFPPPRRLHRSAMTDLNPGDDRFDLIGKKRRQTKNLATDSCLVCFCEVSRDRLLCPMMDAPIWFEPSLSRDKEIKWPRRQHQTECTASRSSGQ